MFMDKKKCINEFGGYNFYNPSVSQLVHQSCFFGQGNSSQTAQQNFVNFVNMKDMMCR